MPDQVFGPLKEADQLEDALEAELSLWIDTYLAAVERKRANPSYPAGSIERPRSWEVEDDIRSMSDRQLPAIVVISTGTTDVDRNSNTIDATYTLAVGVAVKGPNRRARRRVAAMYAAAIRDLVLHQGIPGAGQPTWLGTEYEQVIARGAREQTRMTATVAFSVHVSEVSHPNAGLISTDTPPALPYGPQPDLPTVSTTVITATPKETP